MTYGSLPCKAALLIAGRPILRISATCVAVRRSVSSGTANHTVIPRENGSEKMFGIL